MQKVKQLTNQTKPYVVSFSNENDCKNFIKEVKSLGYKWCSSQSIEIDKPLDFYFNLFVDVKNLTVGYISPMCMRSLGGKYNRVYYR